MGKENVTFVSRRIYAGDRPFAGYVTVADGQILSTGTGLPAGDAGKVVDVGDARVIPGLIDLHSHGFLGMDFVSTDRDAIPKVARALAEAGTTAFQPTSATSPVDILDRFILRAEELADGPVCGARVIGSHMEGPFLNAVRKGAMVEEFLLTPSLEQMEKWLDLGNGTINQVTIAPEMPGAMDVIRFLADNGVTVSAGHTDASYEQMEEAIRAGVSLACHTFNAMRPLNHREPGVLGSVLTNKNVTCELISDCQHIHPAVMRLIIQAKGPAHVAAITDASQLAGLPPGKYEAGGVVVTMEPSGLARLPGGTIAGSSATMVKCLRNLVEVVGVTFEDALQMTAATPARVAGVNAFKGSLAVGKDADIVVLDNDYNVLWSLVEGEVMKEAGS